MVDNIERRRSLDRVFAAVADPTRRAILSRLRKGPASIGEIARPFSVSLNAISKHVKVLEGAGLVRRRVVGRRHYCVAEPKAMEDAEAWLAHYRSFWTARLDALERHLIRRRPH